MRRFVVITPVFNGSRFIRETLVSVDRQSWPEWIHIIVDGGSTDGTIEIVRQSAEKEPRRHLITGVDHGIYDAVFKGIEAADCYPDDILLWINSDDMLAPWAFLTMKSAFDTGAEWVTALPGQWDEEGRLTHVVPSAWYPRRFLRWGLFHGRALGWLQQESTFFSRKLLDSADAAVISRVRASRYAGDFMLWREFSRHAPLTALTTVISGFRKHGANASAAQDRYFAELTAAGGWIPPRFLATAMRAVYRFFALFVTAGRARRVSRSSQNLAPGK